MNLEEELRSCKAVTSVSSYDLGDSLDFIKDAQRLDTVKKKLSQVEVYRIIYRTGNLAVVRCLVAKKRATASPDPLAWS